MIKKKKNKYTIYVADWIVPICKRPIKDGAVVVDLKRKIVEVGSMKSILDKYRPESEFIYDYKKYALMPAIINAHTHLYYSAHRDIIEPSRNFYDWIKQIVEKRDKVDKELIRKAIINTADLLYRRGISLVGNICTEMLWDSRIVSKTKLKGINFLEVIGFSSEKAADQLNSLPSQKEMLLTEEDGFYNVFSPHSSYGNQPEMIKIFLSIARKRGLPCSIHLSESPDENRMFQYGNGEIIDFLKQIDALYKEWTSPHLSTVKFLERERCLAPNLIAVHVVHLDNEDINILKRRNVKCVLCPGANRYLNVGKAPFKKLYESGILLGVGTDSISGNYDLDLFNEIRYLKEDYPEIASRYLLEMITINGARILGFDRGYGSLEREKLADIIAIPVPGEFANDYQIEQYIVKEIEGDNIVRLLPVE